MRRGIAEAEQGVRREEEMAEAAAAAQQGLKGEGRGGVGQQGEQEQQQEEEPAAGLAVGDGASVPLEQLVLPVSGLVVGLNDWLTGGGGMCMYVRPAQHNKTDQHPNKTHKTGVRGGDRARNADDAGVCGAERRLAAQLRAAGRARVQAGAGGYLPTYMGTYMRMLGGVWWMHVTTSVSLHCVGVRGRTCTCPYVGDDDLLPNQSPKPTHEMRRFRRRTGPGPGPGVGGACRGGCPPPTGRSRR